MLTSQRFQPEKEIRERAEEAIHPFHGSPHRISGKHPNSRVDQASQLHECEAKNLA